MVSLPSSVTSVNRDVRIGEEDSEYGERKRVGVVSQTETCRGRRDPALGVGFA